MATFYEETGTIVDEWHVDDVFNQRPDLTEDQAIEVLAFIAEKFDANIGINWDVIDSAADYLYPEEDEYDATAVLAELNGEQVTHNAAEL